MVDAFVEGVRSIVQVCHLVILVPVALAIVAARGRWAAVLGGVAGVVLGGWLFATDAIGAITEPQLRFTAIVLIVLVATLAFPRVLTLRRSARLRTVGAWVRSPVGIATVAGVVGVTVTQWWRPCVGAELGSILTAAPDDPLGQLLPTVAFMLGISMPLVAIGLLYAAWRPSATASGRAAWIGAVLTVVVSASVLAGHHGEIVARLFEWSQ